MHYREYPLNGLLSKYIQTIWSIDSENEQDAYPRSLIMPDGIVEIIFHYQQPFYYYQDNTRLLLNENVAVSMMKKYIEIESSGNTGLIAARFYPWGAYHFFDAPVSSFLDSTIDAVQLWGNDSNRIIADLRTGETPDERFKMLEEFLLKCLNRFRKDETKTNKALKLIRETKGILSIEEVCDQSGFDKKQLERKFVKLIGATPKIFSRVCRFLNICQHLEEQKNKTLTELAYECGYYDQSHFINDFKEFSGFTPKDFFEKENIWFTKV